jgi:hypothetical protein
MEIQKVFCMFEQSGTFKNCFRKHGISAEDYDILNDFGETDHVIDLFSEINRAYDGNSSLFDEVGSNDLVLAFFPCTRFEAKVPLLLRGELAQQKKWDDEKKLDYSMKIHDELHMLYTLICKLFTISIRGGWRLVVENPYMQPHYLRDYFPVKPKLIIKDRTIDGDYFKKPTQFWFINCSPENNVIFEPISFVPTYTIARVEKMNSGHNRTVSRSLIHPQFADRFIRNYILDDRRDDRKGREPDAEERAAADGHDGRDQPV